MEDFLEEVTCELARAFQEERTTQKPCRGCPGDNEQEMWRDL